MSHIQRPLTLPKHPELLRKLNQMCIDIKIHYLIKTETIEPTQLSKLQFSHEVPTWEAIVELLTEARNAINEQREDPRKY